MNDDFAVFILSHGRPDRVKTLKALDKGGYTGKIYIVIDDEDVTVGDYVDKFGDKVIVFSKDKTADKFDIGDNFVDKKVVVYARNAVFDIAKNLKVKYFLVLDDDYTHFAYKFDRDFNYKDKNIRDLNSIFAVMLKYYKSMDCLSLTMAQNGDFIGGKKGGFGTEIKMKRKAMNTFFCSVDRPFKFVGRINEDVNTYVNLGSKGKLFLTINNISVDQTTTQKNKGGLTDAYLELGTYVKSFYSVMYSPSCVRVSMMGDKHRRLHHEISWNNAVPKILREVI